MIGDTFSQSHVIRSDQDNQSINKVLSMDVVDWEKHMTADGINNDRYFYKLVNYTYDILKESANQTNTIEIKMNNIKTILCDILAFDNEANIMTSSAGGSPAHLSTTGARINPIYDYKEDKLEELISRVSNNLRTLSWAIRKNMPDLCLTSNLSNDIFNCPENNKAQNKDFLKGT